MATKYRQVIQKDCPDEEFLEQQGKEGYQLVSHAFNSQSKKYCIVLRYVGGLGANKAVNRGH